MIKQSKQRMFYTCMLFLAMSVGTVLGQEKSTVTILINGNIIDGSLNSTVKKGNVIIRNDSIIKVDYLGAKLNYPGANIIDVEGKYLLPGLIDSHVHLTTALKNDRLEMQQSIETVLDKMLFSGVTTVRDMVGNGAVLAGYKRASLLNQLPAPSIYYAARFAGPAYFSQTRKHESAENKIDYPWERTVTKDTDLTLAIAEAKGSGATGIKIYADFEAELLENIVKEAARQGVMTWSHATLMPASSWHVARAKVQSMSHAWDMMYGLSKDGTIDREDLETEIDYDRLDDLLEIMKNNNIILDPTNFMAENNKLVNSVKITKRAKERGVKVCVGTDWPYFLDKDAPIYVEMQILVDKCGFSELEAIHSATKLGAESIGLTDRGEIVEGKRADIYLLNSNPLENIGSIKDGYMVVKSGLLYPIKNKS